MDDGSGTTVAFSVTGPVPQLFGVRLGSDGTPGAVQRLTTLYTDYSGFTIGASAGGNVSTVWDHPLACNSTVRSELWPSAGASPDPEQVVSVPQDGVDLATVASDAGGVADVVDDGCSAATASAVTELRPWPHAGALGTPLQLSSPGAESLGSPVIAIDPAGEATAVWLQLSTADQLQLAGARISPRGTIDGAVQILSNSDPIGPQLAVTPTGDATVVWDQGNGVHQTVYGARWPAAGVPSTPIAISTNAGPNTSPDDIVEALAVDPAGNATIGWQEGLSTDDSEVFGFSSSYGSVDARLRRWRASGSLTAVTPAVTAGGVDIADDAGGDSAIVLSEAGSAYTNVAEEDWPTAAAAPSLSTDLGADVLGVDAFDAAGDLFLVTFGNNGNGPLALRVRSAGSGSFGAPQSFSSPGAYEDSPLSVDGVGDAAIADRVTTADPNNDLAQATVRLANGTVCPVQQLGPLGSGGAIPDLALSSGGSGVAVWESFDGTTDQLQSARFASGCPGSSGPPVDTVRPSVGGSAKVGGSLSCSTGSWTNSPTGYAYQWKLSGTPIAGAGSALYKVQSLDEGLSLSCTVVASNAKGAGAPASSNVVKILVPRVKRCPAATGKLSGSGIGRLKLGMTRSRARQTYRKSSTRKRKYVDFFCLTPRGIRDGYGSPKLPRADRGRVIWISTALAYYLVDGVRVTAAIASVHHAVGPFKVGKNDWYFAPNGASNAIFKVRRGVIEEIGIADKALTTGKAAERRFLTSFS